MKKFKKLCILSAAVAELTAFVVNSSCVNYSTLAFINKNKKSSTSYKNRTNEDLFNIVKKYLEKYKIFLYCFSTSLVFGVLGNCLAKKIIDNITDVNEQEKEKISKGIKDVNTNTTQKSKLGNEDEVVPGSGEDLYKECVEQINEEISKGLVIKKICVAFYILLIIWFLLALKIIKHHEEVRKAREQEIKEKLYVSYGKPGRPEDIEKNTKTFIPEPKNINKEYNENGEEVVVIECPSPPDTVNRKPAYKYEARINKRTVLRKKLIEKDNELNNLANKGDDDSSFYDADLSAESVSLKNKNDFLFPDFYNEIKRNIENVFGTGVVTLVNQEEFILLQKAPNTTLKIQKSTLHPGNYKVYLKIGTEEKSQDNITEEDAKVLFVGSLSKFIRNVKNIEKNYIYEKGKIIEKNKMEISSNNILNEN